MKKHFFAALLVAVMCLAVLSGCSFAKALEKDLQVILEVNGEYYDSYTVNIFNNAVVPEPETEDRKIFKGWTLEENWQEKAIEEVALLENTGLIRYDDIKDHVKGDRASVTVYAVFADPIAYDLVIGWYSKTSTSGLDQGIMDSFETAMYTYLDSKGHTTASMLIEIRDLGVGGVADIGAIVNKDGDIDLIFGMGNNITSTGGIEIKKDTQGNELRQNGVSMGAKTGRNVSVVEGSTSEVAMEVWYWLVGTENVDGWLYSADAQAVGIYIAS